MSGVETVPSPQGAEGVNSDIARGGWTRAGKKDLLLGAWSYVVSGCQFFGNESDVLYSQNNTPRASRYISTFPKYEDGECDLWGGFNFKIMIGVYFIIDGPRCFDVDDL